jgi:hypothetical protein
MEGGQDPQDEAGRCSDTNRREREREGWWELLGDHTGDRPPVKPRLAEVSRQESEDVGAILGWDGPVQPKFGASLRDLIFAGARCSEQHLCWVARRQLHRDEGKSDGQPEDKGRSYQSPA